MNSHCSCLVLCLVYAMPQKTDSRNKDYTMSSQSCELCQAMLFSSQAQEQCSGVISLGDREAAFGKWIYTPALAVVGVDHNGPEWVQMLWQLADVSLNFKGIYLSLSVVELL